MDYLYIDTNSINGYIITINRLIDNMLNTCDKFYKQVNGVSWNDEISDRVFDVYSEIAGRLSTLFQEILSVSSGLKEQLRILDKYRI